MSNSNVLIECAREVYEREKGLGFNKHSTFIEWHTPPTTPLEQDLRLDPLVLASPDDEFRVVKARLWVGLAEAQMHILENQGDTTYLKQFAERFAAAYEVHDHEFCIQAAQRVIFEQQIALFNMRKPVSGEITKY